MTPLLCCHVPGLHRGSKWAFFTGWGGGWGGGGGCSLQTELIHLAVQTKPRCLGESPQHLNADRNLPLPPGTAMSMLGPIARLARLAHDGHVCEPFQPLAAVSLGSQACEPLCALGLPRMWRNSCGDSQYLN